LSVVPEKKSVKNGEVCFVKLRYTDKNGVVKPLERGMVEVKVEGGELLALGNACPFNSVGYNGTKTDTYYGEAMAVVKATDGTVKIFATDGKLSGKTEITADAQ
jgi:beta-galactosidase